MKDTLQEVFSTLVGLPCAALPLSECRIVRPYLLDRCGIGDTGTALLTAVPYLIAADARDPARNISLYAVPRDYHGYITQLTDGILPALREAFPGAAFGLFADHAPIAEVNAAARAGLGVRGRNGLLITPEYGSFVFITELITDLPYEAVTGRERPAFPDEPPACPGCGRCAAACPRGVCGSADGDKSHCLSALTQKKGALTAEEEAIIAQAPLAWGCDDCQIVCPLNRAALSGGHDTPLAYFREGRLTCLSPAVLDGMTDEEFQSRAYAWRGRAVIRRNLMLQERRQNESETAPHLIPCRGGH